MKTNATSWPPWHRAQALLANVETEIRRVIYDLHPPILDEQGLLAALKRFADSHTATFDVPCDIQSEGVERRLPRPVEVAIYRIVQEALHNVATHAHASLASVHLQYKELTEQFFWSEATVKRKVQEILAKLGATNRAQAVAEAIRRGYI